MVKNEVFHVIKFPYSFAMFYLILTQFKNQGRSWGGEGATVAETPPKFSAQKYPLKDINLNLTLFSHFKYC